MPSVTLSFERSRDWSDNGCCFGFTGRSGSVLNHGSGNITNYKYNLSQAWGGASLTKEGLDNSPVKAWDFLASEGSPWAKYVTMVNHGSENLSRSWSVDIKTDIPGHAVIGTASVFRFIKYLSNGGYGLCIFNEAIKLGGHPVIALLVSSMALNANSRLRGGGSLRTSFQSVPELGDDIPFKLTRIDLSDLFALIDGTWEFEVRDEDRPDTYATSGRYSQRILSSYETGSFNFPHYIMNRFFPQTSMLTAVAQRAGMGQRRVESRQVSRSTTTMEPLALIGVILQLSSEYKTHKAFAGLSLKGGNSNGK